MIEYTFTYTATDEEIAESQAEAVNLFESVADAQHEVQVLLSAFDSLHSKYEVDVAFGKEIFRLFQEAHG